MERCGQANSGLKIILKYPNLGVHLSQLRISSMLPIGYHDCLILMIGLLGL